MINLFTIHIRISCCDVMSCSVLSCVYSFLIKWWNYIKICMKSYPWICSVKLFFTDWYHLHCKNTIEISSIYWNLFLWIFSNWFKRLFPFASIFLVGYYLLSSLDNIQWVTFFKAVLALVHNRQLNEYHSLNTKHLPRIMYIK